MKNYVVGDDRIDPNSPVEVCFNYSADRVVVTQFGKVFVVSFNQIERR